MQDLRAVPPVSKTTIVIVLVVFGLVLVVSVFGLWAFSSYEDLRRADLREAAVRDARSHLEGIQRSLDRRMDGLLWRVGGVDGPKALRSVQDSTMHGALVREIFRFDTRGDIRWVDRAYRLHAGAEHIETDARWQATRVDARDQKFDDIERLRPAQGAAAVLPIWQEVVDGWGLLTQNQRDDTRLLPVGVGYAVQLLRTAWEVVDADPDSAPVPSVRRAIMRALEIETLWQQRKQIKSLSTRLEQLGAEIQRLLDRLPEAARTGLEWEVHRYRHYRDYVAHPLRQATLEGALRKVDRPGRYVLFDTPELLGVIREGAGDTIVARLDPGATLKIVEGFINPATFSALGMHAGVFPSGEGSPLYDGLEPKRELALDEMPYKLAVFQIGEPKEARGGMTDLLFWVVIGLAAAGLVVGGYVLIRLLTREIRVAQLKADFVSNLSHELKTPITSISLFTEMLDDGKLIDPEEQQEAFSILADESQRLQRIVARMINVARGEARRNPFELEAEDLNAVVMEVATRFRRITTEPGLDLVLALFPEPLPIRMDEQAMDDAVTNLMSNAWKYKRGDQVRITVRTARRGRHAELVVSDDGVGIPREDRRRVFEMFYRANQFLTHPVAGTGLGLALVRNVVRGHKGTIRVEAGEGGKGAAFRLRFPLDLMGVAADEQAAVSTPMSPQESQVREAQPPAPHVTLPDDGTLDEAQTQ